MNAPIPFLFAMLLAFNTLAQSSQHFETIINDGLPIGNALAVSDNCSDAEFLCNGLANLSGTLSDNNLQQVYPGCPANVLNNDEWFSFMAGSSTITLQVIPQNCQGTFGQFGMQGAIYTTCIEDPLAIQCECTDLPFTLSSSLFVPGQTYYFVLDGCGGDICDYTVEVLQGATVCFPTVVGPATVCNGDTATYSIQNYTQQAYSIEWLPIANATYSIMGDSITVVWDSSFTGVTQVCALATDTNLMALQICIDVLVNTFTQPEPVGPSEACINDITTYEMTDVQTCDHGQSFYWSVANGVLASGSPTDSVINVSWSGQGAGEVCLNNILGSDTIPHCIAVNVLVGIDCGIGPSCETATFLCGGLDGFSSTLSTLNIPAEFPGCPGNALNNPDWYAFVAGDKTITLQIVPSNCHGTNGQFGMQAAIYTACGGFSGSAYGTLAAQCLCTEDSFNLSSSQFVPGQTYYIVFDGCAGDICDFTVNVLQGSTNGLPNIAGPTLVCEEGSATYSIDTPFAGQYTVIWEPIQNASLTILGDGNSILVQWDSLFTGMTQVCATISDSCQQVALVCLDVEVTVLTLPDPVGPVLVCQSEQSLYQFSDLGPFCQGFGHYWSVTNGVLLTDPTDIEAEVAWLGDSTSEVCLHLIPNPSDTIIKCLSIAFLPADNPFCFPCDSLQADAGEFIINCNTSSISDTIIGTTNLPDSIASYQWTFNGSVVSNTDTVIIEAFGQYVFTVTNIANGCVVSDTFQLIQDIDMPIAFAGQFLILSCLNPEVVLDGSGSSTGPNIIYEWTGPNGFVSNDITSSVSTEGTYTLTVTNTQNGCTASDVVTVSFLPIDIIIEVEMTPDSCHTNSGTASVGSILGAPFTILWSTGDTINTISGLSAGNYSVTVTFGVCEFYDFFAIDSVACTATSELFAGTRFQLLPNPNDGQFSVLLDVATPTTLEMELLDALGRSIATVQPMKAFGKGQHQIDFQQAGLSSGMYYLVIKNETGRMGVKVEVVR
jgi:Secretion system C-terminal sorting domain